MSSGTRGHPYSRRIATLQRAATRFHTLVFRSTNGLIGGWTGGPVLLLNTTGRKSGQRRTTPLLYLRDGDDLVIVASNGGSSTPPAWWLNLKANPAATVELAGQKARQFRAEEADGEEKRRLWPLLVEMYSGYESYQTKTDREIPVVILRPVMG